MSDVQFNAPGKGPWEIESTHFTGPVTPSFAECFQKGFPEGFTEATARYGVLLVCLKPAVVNGFVYTQPVPFGAPPGALKPPPKFVFKLITRLLPSMRRRIATSHAAFENKLWREDLKRWDNEVRPAAIEAHRAIQRVDPATLDTAGLVAHLNTCREHWTRMIKQHHQFTIVSTITVGDFLAHVQAWTGMSTGEALQVFRGASPVSANVAGRELDALAAAIKNDGAARELLGANGDPAATIAQLRDKPGAVGEAMRAYLDVVSYRSLGYDIASLNAIELPHTLIECIRSAVDGTSRSGAGAREERVRALRERVPEAHRAAFDELLAEATAMYRLRDERGWYSDSWACGLVRRAVLEAGARLAKSGKITAADQLIDASFDEIAALLEGKGGPSADELRKRTEWRTTKNFNDAPPWLTAAPAPPPPVDWLPEKARRTQRAVETVLHGLFVAPTPETSSEAVKGLPVSPGVYEGVARLVMSERDFGKLQKGDVLVTRATSPYFNVVLPLLGGIVTDRGGQLSHAAIVAREYGIPGVVGTTDATRVIRDGARVRVDGTSGEVRLIG